MRIPRKRKISFIVAFLLALLSQGIRAQVSFKPDGFFPGRTVGKTTWQPAQTPLPGVFRTGLLLNQKQPSNPVSGLARYDHTVLRADFYAGHLGFFCRKEWELEKSIRFPLRFRLGSLEYCNRLEGKK